MEGTQWISAKYFLVCLVGTFSTVPKAGSQFQRNTDVSLNVLLIRAGWHDANSPALCVARARM